MGIQRQRIERDVHARVGAIEFAVTGNIERGEMAFFDVHEETSRRTLDVDITFGRNDNESGATRQRDGVIHGGQLGPGTSDFGRIPARISGNTTAFLEVPARIVFRGDAQAVGLVLHNYLYRLELLAGIGGLD